MNAAESVLKREEITEEDPILDIIETTMSSTDVIEDPPEVAGTSKRYMEDDEKEIVKEEPVDEDFDLETKIEIVDDMLPFTTTAEDSDIREFVSLCNNVS